MKQAQVIKNTEGSNESVMRGAMVDTPPWS